MKILRIVLMVSAALAISCDKDSKSDPGTTTPDELNPPFDLKSTTGDKSVTLTWASANSEEGFHGYHVFMRKGEIKDLTASVYPKAGLNLALAGIPRCAQNTALFEQFGFKTSEADCEGDTDADENADGNSDAADDTGLYMQAADDSGGDTGTDEEGSDPLDIIVPCKTDSADDISKKVSAPAIGMQSCVIEGLTNGLTYTFFVVSVMGDDKETISWTSNFVEDTPATLVFDGDLTVKATKYYRLDSSKLVGTGGSVAKMTAEVADWGENDCTAALCNFGASNASSNDAGIYLGRQGSGSFPQRIFFSTPSGGDIAFLFKGAMRDGAASSPGDQASQSSNYITDGTGVAIKEGVIVDIKVTKSGASHYGKVVFSNITLATATDPTSDMTVSVKIFLQDDADNPHYLQ